MQPEFDLNRIPFSRFGSFMAISQLGPDYLPGLYLRSVSGGDSQSPIFRLALCDATGKELEYTSRASAVKIVLASESGAALQADQGQHQQLGSFDAMRRPASKGVLEQAAQKIQVRRQEPKVGRNDPCPCGSGKKYKRCCGLGAGVG